MAIKAVHGFGSGWGLTQFWCRKGGAYVSPQWDCDLWLIFLQMFSDAQWLGHFTFRSTSRDRAFTGPPPVKTCPNLSYCSIRFRSSARKRVAEPERTGCAVLFKLGMFLEELRSVLLVFIFSNVPWIYLSSASHALDSFSHLHLHQTHTVWYRRRYRYHVWFGPVHRVKTLLYISAQDAIVLDLTMQFLSGPWLCQALWRLASTLDGFCPVLIEAPPFLCFVYSLCQEQHSCAFQEIKNFISLCFWMWKRSDGAKCKKIQF